MDVRINFLLSILFETVTLYSSRRATCAWVRVTQSKWPGVTQLGVATIVTAERWRRTLRQRSLSSDWGWNGLCTQCLHAAKWGRGSVSWSGFCNEEGINSLDTITVSASFCPWHCACTLSSTLQRLKFSVNSCFLKDRKPSQQTRDNRWLWRLQWCCSSLAFISGDGRWNENPSLLRSIAILGFCPIPSLHQTRGRHVEGAWISWKGSPMDSPRCLNRMPQNWMMQRRIKPAFWHISLVQKGSCKAAEENLPPNAGL